MNAYLGLTKLEGAGKTPALLAVIKSAVPLEGEADSSPDRSGFLEKVIREYRNSWKEEQHRAWYSHIFKQYYSIGPLLAAEQCTVKSVSPLVIGHGVFSVLETHLTLHPVYGMPYLPGTALKGAAAHYCHRYLGGEDPDFREGGSAYRLLFGSGQQAGCITYHDAWATPDSAGQAFRLDVLTPHHQRYHQMGQLDPAYAPRDDDDPVPIPFIAVSAAFQVMLTSEANADADNEWLGIAADILLQALAQEGIGAKTRAGYGRMKAGIR
ncbi:type III-B CRISPR module RAMP protein Cmr6 [Paenibacillus sp. S150]|uniref:type III-B CRISPR module RAMP protein Cmr6 n=1 Tax=Paenibacillus sp. S150 TaxID=2749826 RepID=UPI001C570D93|nr:type III-B CRISPR module RAMP protein Cmr6 [Paenibacillus sp. S150]MBW4082506.1 type III-B CRISPR module RAMP protein Cmr6 [Paenibacillus sp. S150]